MNRTIGIVEIIFIQEDGTKSIRTIHLLGEYVLHVRVKLKHPEMKWNCALHLDWCLD